MKKLIFSLLVLTFSGSLLAQNGWKFGVGSGLALNNSKFSGGNPDAHARFHQNPFGSGVLAFHVRKDITDHLIFQSGWNVMNQGFEFAIAENYPLTDKKKQFTKNQIGMQVARIPATLIWRFNPTCRNWRWFVGGGVSLTGTHIQTNTTQNVVPEVEKVANPNTTSYLSQDFNGGSLLTLNGHLTAGIEKTFKSGKILSFAWVWNRGFTPIATSTVNYQLDGQNYSHQFTNKGNFGSFMVSYYFKTFGEKKKNTK